MRRRTPKEVVIRGTSWCVEFVPDVQVAAAEYGEHRYERDHLDGAALRPESVILIDEDLRGVDLLETLAHELVHALEPTWTEQRVDRFAREMAAALWTCGVRVR